MDSNNKVKRGGRIFINTINNDKNKYVIKHLHGIETKITIIYKKNIEIVLTDAMQISLGSRKF